MPVTPVAHRCLKPRRHGIPSGALGTVNCPSRSFMEVTMLGSGRPAKFPGMELPRFVAGMGRTPAWQPQRGQPRHTAQDSAGGAHRGADGHG